MIRSGTAIPRVVPLIVLVLSLLLPQKTSIVSACTQPGRTDIAAAFDLTANGLLPARYPQLTGMAISTIPPSVLKAVGWVESGWRQFSRSGKPLVSYDFGYGIMQITSGMAGAFGRATGDLDPTVQSNIASDYVFNIAYGARLLAAKLSATPQVGDGDPTTVENWYYALWAYNGWGWVNNPNNPRFTRTGTPASNPSAFPYQERVLYLVAHPPRDPAGNPLWATVKIHLPSRTSIGRNPGPLALRKTDRQPAPALSAVYASAKLPALAPLAHYGASVRVTNTGTSPWVSKGDAAVGMTYHLFSAEGNPWQAASPFATGVVAFAQGYTVLPRSLLPGQSATVSVNVTAPALEGTYWLVWDLQRGTTLWFSQAGTEPHAQRLHVGTSGVSSTPPPVIPTSTPQPQNGLQFVADTSVPDGTRMSAGQQFVKAWLVYNSGRLNWGANWDLVRVSGKSFGASRITVPLTQRCHSAELIATMRAPTKSGTYTGRWRLQDPSGTRFGQVLTVVITVSGPPRPAATATPLPTPTPLPKRTPRPSPSPTPAG